MVCRAPRPEAAMCLALCAAGAAAATPAGAAPWTWPVRGRIVSRFALGPDPYAPGQRRGIVIAATAGMPVRAACGGTVTFAGPVGDSGLTAAIACGRLSSTYVHLGSLGIRRGAVVARGERIGTVGASGSPRADVPQVGLGARRRAGAREYVDPLRLLGDPDPARPAAPVGPPAGRWARRPPEPAGPRPASVPEPSLEPAAARPASSRVARPAVPVPALRAPGRPGGDLPLGPLWLPAGAGLLAAGLGVGGIGAAVVASRRRRRARAVGPPATRGGAQARR